MKQINYQVMTYKNQLKTKQKLIEKAFLPLKSKVPVSSILKNPMDKHYRHKVTVSATSKYVGKSVKLRLGMFKENTHKIEPGFSHFIHDNDINTVLAVIESILNDYKISAYDIKKRKGILKHVLIRKSYLTQDMLVVFVTNTKFFPNHKQIVKDLREEFSQIKTVIQMVQNKHTPIALYGDAITLFGPGYIIDGFDQLTFKLSAKSFYQVNPIQMINLYHHAIDLAQIKKTDVVMDCYAGIGTISLLAAKHANKVIGIEVNRQAVIDAKENIKKNHMINVTFVQSDVEDYMASFHGKVDVLILDPTRTGATPKFLNAVKKLKPKKIVYISCFVETQVRDIKQLLTQYEITHIQPVDMFSYTEHVETITLLSLKTA